MADFNEYDQYEGGDAPDYAAATEAAPTYSSEGGSYAPDLAQQFEQGRAPWLRAGNPLPEGVGTPTARDYTPTGADRAQNPQFWAGVDQRNAFRQQQLDFQQRMASMPLSQADRLQLMRMQNGLALVQQRVASGEYDQQTGQDFEMLLMTNIDPLMRRQRMAQIRQIEEHTQMQAAQNAMAEIQLDHTRRFRAMQAADGTFPISGMPGRYQLDQHGVIQPVKPAERQEPDPVTGQMEATIRDRHRREVRHEMDQARRENRMPSWYRGLALFREEPAPLPGMPPSLIPRTEQEVVNAEAERRAQEEMALTRGSRGYGGSHGQRPTPPNAGTNLPAASSPRNAQTSAAIDHINQAMGLRAPATPAAPAAPPASRPWWQEAQNTATPFQ